MFEQDIRIVLTPFRWSFRVTGGYEFHESLAHGDLFLLTASHYEYKYRIARYDAASVNLDIECYWAVFMGKPAVFDWNAAI